MTRHVATVIVAVITSRLSTERNLSFGDHVQVLRTTRILERSFRILVAPNVVSRIILTINRNRNRIRSSAVTPTNNAQTLKASRISNVESHNHLGSSNTNLIARTIKTEIRNNRSIIVIGAGAGARFGGGVVAGIQAPSAVKNINAVAAGNYIVALATAKAVGA